jgi:hypothetical protein
MVDATISRGRMRALARLGRSRQHQEPPSRPLPLPSASRRRAVTDAASIGNAPPPRPRAASPRSDTGDLMASTI